MILLLIKSGVGGCSTHSHDTTRQQQQQLNYNGELEWRRIGLGGSASGEHEPYAVVNTGHHSTTAGMHASRGGAPSLGHCLAEFGREGRTLRGKEKREGTEEQVRRCPSSSPSLSPWENQQNSTNILPPGIMTCLASDSIQSTSKSSSAS